MLNIHESKSFVREFVRIAGDVFNGDFVLSFFPWDVLDEIWDLIESVFECSLPTLSDRLQKIKFKFPERLRMY